MSDAYPSKSNLKGGAARPAPGAPYMPSPKRDVAGVYGETPKDMSDLVKQVAPLNGDYSVTAEDK